MSKASSQRVQDKQTKQTTADTAQPTEGRRRSVVQFTSPNYTGGRGGQRRASQGGNGDGDSPADEILPAPTGPSGDPFQRMSSHGRRKSSTAATRSSTGTAPEQRRSSQRVSLGDISSLNPAEFRSADPLKRQATERSIGQAAASVPWYQNFMRNGRPNGVRAHLLRLAHPSNRDGGVRRSSEGGGYLRADRYGRNSRPEDWERQQHAPQPQSKRRGER